jgi:hypothetical protein
MDYASSGRLIDDDSRTSWNGAKMLPRRLVVYFVCTRYVSRLRRRPTTASCCCCCCCCCCVPSVRMCMCKSPPCSIPIWNGRALRLSTHASTARQGRDWEAWRPAEKVWQFGGYICSPSRRGQERRVAGAAALDFRLTRDSVLLTKAKVGR